MRARDLVLLSEVPFMTSCTATAAYVSLEGRSIHWQTEMAMGDDVEDGAPRRPAARRRFAASLLSESHPLRLLKSIDNWHVHVLK